MEAAFRVRYTTRDKLDVFVARDVSRGGMFLATSRLLPVNSVIRLHIALPDGAGELPVISRVAHVRGEAEARATGKPVGIGIQFLDLDGARLIDLIRFLEASGVAPDPPPLEEAGAEHEPIRLVVVDDRSGDRERVAAIFGGRGDLVRTAGDGVEALALCLREPPDIVVSDVEMPVMDGFELARVLRARPTLATVPLVFLTGLRNEDDRLRGYQLGADDYLTKPWNDEELLLRIDRTVLRAHRARLPRTTLRGDLTQLSLASLLSLLELERKTGVLLLVAGSAARLFLRGGQPVRVEIDGRKGGASQRELLFEILGWAAGQFEFAPADVLDGDELGMSLTALLLEHARFADEARR